MSILVRMILNIVIIIVIDIIIMNDNLVINNKESTLSDLIFQ